jgi:Uma2 family endonuclease
MSRQEFHRRYELTPKEFRAELIGGTVYVASPLRLGHGANHLPLGAIFCHYSASTPGVESADNVTVFLADDSEPQPDLFMRIAPEFGGQSATTPDDYIDGAPELVAEIAVSSLAIDLNAKKADYEKYGVLEYIVVCVGEKQVRWFDLARRRELKADADEIIRARRFPGLWIDVEALLARDLNALMLTLQKGLASPEHGKFVKKLAAQKKRS